MVTGHPSFYRAFGKNGARTTHQELKENFDNVNLLFPSENVDKLLRGLLTQPVEKADNNFINDVRNDTNGKK